MANYTEEQKKKYIDKEGGHCPVCKSDQIEGGSIDMDGSHVWQNVSCLECPEQWVDQYNLIGMERVE